MTKLTAEQKLRIKIAKDVIKQLDAKKIRPLMDNCYIQPPTAKGKPCTVCAVGAVFVARYGVADAGDHLDNEYETWYGPPDEASAPFPREELIAMDNAFEGTGAFLGRHWPLRRIMNNIIKNNGTFAP